MEVASYNLQYSHVDVGAASPVPHGPNSLELESSQFHSESSQAATRVQKMYRSYRTRRRLADSAVVAEELWWQALDFVRLNHSTVSFFNYAKPESAVSRWNRVSLNASKVGQGLSKDSKALKLAFQHWIEAIDPRHRYGHNLHIYYEKWCESTEGQPFFYWLDIGDGKIVDLPECPRTLLREQHVKYLGPKEREHFEYIVSEGKIVHKQTGDLLDTGTDGSKGSKWIFVMSPSDNLYAGKKKKGMFHHSSFLAGGTTTAAGRFTAENGILKSIWAYSGHYKPSAENLANFLAFLQKDGVDLDEVEVRSSSNEDYYEEPKENQNQTPPKKEPETTKFHELTTKFHELTIEVLKVRSSSNEDYYEEPKENQNQTPPKKEPETTKFHELTTKFHELTIEVLKPEPKPIYKRTLSGGLQSPKAQVPQKIILERIKSKGKTKSYQLGNQLSFKWTTGAGPRIGCVADYPMEVRRQALEIVNLSCKGGLYGNLAPRSPLTPSRYLSSSLSPSSSGEVE